MSKTFDAPLITTLVPAVAAAVLASATFDAAAANLTVGLGTDVTSIDPHYHNLTPNNNVASHLYGYLVERNEKSQPQPSLATEWKAIDPTTWEFKLRRGVKVHDGSDFTGDFSGTVGMQYKFSQTWGITGEAEFGDNGESYLVGLRASF